MGILEHHNQMAGAFTEGQPGLIDHRREGRVWGVVSMVAALAWLVGLGSLVALAAGTYSWMEFRRANVRPTVAIIGVALGATGLVVAVVILLWELAHASPDL